MILQSLNALYNRLSKDSSNNLPLPGYSLQDISINIVLSQSGELIEIQDIRDQQVTIGKNGRKTKQQNNSSNRTR